MRHLSKLAVLVLIVVSAIPAHAVAQDFPRDEVDEALDALATERAQSLNSAYYDYETALEEARVEAQRADEPDLYDERRTELRNELERTVLAIERRYEERRADILYRDPSDRHEPREVKGRFDPAPSAREEALGGFAYTAERNDEVALAWSRFNQAAEEAHEEAERTGDWDDYEATLTRLENEYDETIAAIEHRYRRARFEELRARYARP